MKRINSNFNFGLSAFTNITYIMEPYNFRPRKKVVCFRLTGCQEKPHLGGRKKKIILFRNIVVLFYSFSIWILYTTFI